MTTKTALLLGVGVLAGGLVLSGTARAHTDDQALAFISGAAIGYVVGSRDVGVRHVQRRHVVHHHHHKRPVYVAPRHVHHVHRKGPPRFAPAHKHHRNYHGKHHSKHHGKSSKHARR